MSKTPAAPLDAIVEIVSDSKGQHAVDANSPAVNFVRFGLFDGALADDSGAFRNEASETLNFVGADSRRFYVRVTDRIRAGTGRVFVTWRTLLPDLRSVVDGAVDPKIVLLETGRGTGVFVSKALMLVNSNLDKQPVHSGLPDADPEGGVRLGTMSNYRIRRATMLDFIEVEYNPLQIKIGPLTNFASTRNFTPVFQRNPEARRRFPVHVFVLRSAIGGQPVVPIDSQATLWNRDLRIAAEVYERIGVRFETIPAAVDAGFKPLVLREGSPRPFTAVLVDPPSALDTTQLLSERGRNVAVSPRFPGLPDTVRIFYGGQLQENAAGISVSDALSRKDEPHNSTSFLDPLERRAHTVAHEVGHLLTAKAQGSNQGHFATPGPPLTDAQNLMHVATVEPKNTEEFKAPKRIWDAPDTDSFNQFEAILNKSRFLRPF